MKIPNAITGHAQSAASIAALRVLLWSIQKLGRDSTTRKIVISLSDLCKQVSMDPHSGFVRMQVFNSVIELTDGGGFYIKTGEGEKKLLPIIGDVKVLDANTFRITFAKEARSLLFTKGGYSVVNIKNILSMRSMRSARMALLLSYLRRLHSASARTISLDDLRFLFMLESPAYKQWKAVRASLRRALQEVREKTRQRGFDIVPIARGNKVIAVRFDPVRKNPPAATKGGKYGISERSRIAWRG